MKKNGISFFICMMLMSCMDLSKMTAPVLEAPLLPSEGVYFGVHLDWQHDNASDFNKRLGISAAVYVAFFRWPFDVTEQKNLDNFVNQVRQQRGLALVTLEPYEGLSAVTPANAVELARQLADYNNKGIPIFLRFAHEMNGYWYPWSQQPIEYVRAFRILATEVHRRASLTAMMWAPNYGGSYAPDEAGYLANPGSENFKLLDTNKDNRIDLFDDMYAPYYPGDDAVDWVGMSAYHWGNKYPWGENEIPESDSFIGRVTGKYVGENGDERSVPNFYDIYVVRHNKPMAVTETAALYNPGAGGDSEYLIKQAWWRQIFSREVLNDFTGIKMINWFEWQKFESEVGSEIDWGVTFDQNLSLLFSSELPIERLVFSNNLDK